MGRAMKHKSSRGLYRYWNERRGRHLAPERAEIDPTAIPRVLADTVLLAVDTGPTVRLAGTRVCALFCREIKGESFIDLFDSISRPAIKGLLEAVCNEALATVAGVAGRCDEGAADLELLLLPLRHRGRMDSRVLGVLAPLAAPYWIGTLPIATLTLGTLRHIVADSLTDAPQLAPSAAQPRSLRGGLIVLDGGRAV